MFQHYVVIALRNIRSAPFTSAINLLTLAVGLVCFVSGYAFVTFWGSAEAHFPKSPDIYVLTLSIKQREGSVGGDMDSVPRGPDVAAEFLRSDFPAITKLARSVSIGGRQTNVASGGRAERLSGVAVDPEFLDMFDLPFVAGDPRSALAAPRSAIITREYATRLFGGSDEAVGKPLVIDNSVDATVTGVIDAIPEPSHLGRSANAMHVDLIASRDLYDAMRGGLAPTAQAWRYFGTLTYVYLPASGAVSPAALRAQLGDFAARHVPPEALKSGDYSFGLEPVGRLLADTGNFYRTGFSFQSVLMLLSALVLGVACVNYANLATARAAGRVREIGVRKALGASPVQIALQSFVEAGAFTLGALVVALAVFVAVRPLLTTRVLRADIDVAFFTSPGAWAALAAFGVAVTLAAGAYPALVLARVRPVGAIAAGRARLGSPLFSALLVSAQFGVASFLLVALTVISMQNAEMRRNALAAIQDPLVLVANPMGQTKVATTTLRERLENVPQVRGVTEIDYPPWEVLIKMTLASSDDPTSPRRFVMTRQVGYDFFDVFNAHLLAGRVFDRDRAEDTPRAATGPGPTDRRGPAPAPPTPGPQQSEPPPPANVVVDRTFAAAFDLGAPEAAVGKLVYRPAPADVQVRNPLPPLRVIGVVEDLSFSFLKTSDNNGAIYSLNTNLGVTVARVAAADLDNGLRAIDATWRELAPNVAVSRQFIDEVFEEAYDEYLRINQLFSVLAVMALAICVAGLFGMAVFVAGRRRREIGVRKTLGASTARMVTLLLAGFAKPVLIANLVAWPASYLAARAYLNQFTPSIALTMWPFSLSAVITLVVACLAVAGQTVRAARTIPAAALRQE